jgi:hypothetical protein
VPTTIPDTFRSQAALADAVDAVFAEALAEELAKAFAAPDTPGPAIELPATEVLIAQAGIATGPCQPDPARPSRSGRLAKTAIRLAGRAAWWLLRTAVCVTALILWGTVRTLWHLTFGGRQLPPEPAPRASDFLTATSDRIAETGWTQYQLQSSAGEMCLIGAERDLIRAGAGTRQLATRANSHLLTTIGARSLPLWNDRLARRQEHIHTALLTAAARARAAGD